MNEKTEVEIVFFSFNSWRAKLIQEFTNSKWNHIGVITSREDGIVTIYEALDEGLTKSQYDEETIDYWLRNGTIEIKTIKTLMSRKQITKRAKTYLGRPYAWFDIFLVTIFKYLKVLKLDQLALHFTSSKHLICSEFIARLLYDISYKTINFAEEYNKPYDLVTPADIYNSSIWLFQELLNKDKIDKKEVERL